VLAVPALLVAVVAAAGRWPGRSAAAGLAAVAVIAGLRLSRAGGQYVLPVSSLTGGLPLPPGFTL